MLSPETRQVAIDLLRPPPGYRLECAVLTTYTLDLEALLALPLAVLAQADSGVEELLRDPLMLLEALREAGERVHVFVDAKGLAIPRVERPLYALLESSVHPVKAPAGGAFHPKLWVARFTADDAPTRLRVAVLSRNLTFDHSWDVALASEAEAGTKRRVATSTELGALMRKLPELSHGEALPEGVGSMLVELAQQLERTDLPAPEGLGDSITFEVLGLDGKRRRPWAPPAAGSRVLAIAPFINRTGLDAVRATSTGEGILISRQEELDRVSAEGLSSWQQVLVVTDAALPEVDDDVRAQPSGLHAKMVAIESGWDVVWCVGSANLTAAAYTGSNVEVMASVTGRKGRKEGSSGSGIDRFLEAGFAQLCVPYSRRELAAEDPLTLEAREKLERACEALVDAPLRVRCARENDQWLWSLEGSAELPDGVEVMTWPVSIHHTQARALELPLAWKLPVDRLTAFVAFHLRVSVKGVDDIRLTRKVPAEGLPDDRLAHVLRTLVNTPERFLRFLRALLGGLSEMMDWSLDGTDGQPAKTPWSDVFDSDAVLEDLMRAASRDPARLLPIRKLIEDLRTTEEGRTIVPDDLLKLWHAVDEAVRARALS